MNARTGVWARGLELDSDRSLLSQVEAGVKRNEQQAKNGKYSYLARM